MSAYSVKQEEMNPTAIPSAPVYSDKGGSSSGGDKKGEEGSEQAGDHCANGSHLDTIKSRMGNVISHEEATIPLAWQALNTGLVDALIYSKSQIWTGFQTGA